MNSFYIGMSRSSCRKAMLLIALVVAVTAAGCRQRARADGETGGFPMLDTSDCLPDIMLVDQHGHKVSLSSLKGRPVLFDFIYTTWPGPCLLLTARMKTIANQVGTALGTEAQIVSITVDPEHDHPQQLLAYAKDFHEVDPMCETTIGHL
jgi:cytochrome oxidase Cu insertion factor (SCO1/SenC/PrrC family)